MKAAKIEAGLSKKRVNNILICLGKILRYAEEAEVIATVPKIGCSGFYRRSSTFSRSRSWDGCSRR